jgi:ABC-type phosphate transport system auxiliary subunit
VTLEPTIKDLRRKVSNAESDRDEKIAELNGVLRFVRLLETQLRLANEIEDKARTAVTLACGRLDAAKDALLAAVLKAGSEAHE